MKHLKRILLVGILTLGVGVLPFRASASTPSIYFSEVNWAGSTASASDEYIELFNPSATAVSLAGYVIEGAATKREPLTLPNDATIQPYSTFLIANYGNENERSAIEATPDFVSATLAVPNTQLELALIDAGGTVVDRALDGTGNPPAGNIGSGEEAFRSMMRVSPNLDGSTSEAWASSTTSLGFKMNAPELGTPGSHSFTLTETSTMTTETEEALVPEVNTTTQEAFQVSPGSRSNVITVIYSGYVFELNLPESSSEPFTISEMASPTSETNSIETTATSSEPSQNNTVEATPEVTTETTSQASTPQEETVPAELETELTAASTETVATIAIAKTLRFSELYPNTTGSDADEEYIEVENFGTELVDLNGWSITDTSGKTWTADGIAVIAPGEALALARELTKITLNNNDESLTLTAPDGTVTDTVSYDKSSKGVTYNREDDSWVWDTPTPNEVTTQAIINQEATETVTETEVEPDAEEQVLEIPEIVLTSSTESGAAAESNSETTSSSSNSVSYARVTINEARALPADSRVEVEGTVSVTPGTFASQYFYIAGSGIQVYMYKAQFPELAVGDRVSVRGVMSQNRGEQRIKTSSTEDITLIESGAKPLPHETELASIDESYEGWLVSIEGDVESVRSSDLTLVDGEDVLTVQARASTNITFSDLSSGSRVRITGIISESNGVYKLLPRSQDDIVKLEANEPLLTMGSITPKNPPTPLYGLLLLAGVLAMLGFWLSRSGHTQDFTLTNA